MFQFWLSWRYLSAGKRWLNPSSLLAIFGMALGVACLVVAMAVVSGFETSLKRAVIDVTGDVVIAKSGSRIMPGEHLPQRIKKVVPEMIAMTPFIQVEAVLANQGKILGVILQGLDPGSVDRVLNLKKRLVAGHFDLRDDAIYPPAIVGRGMMRRMNLKIGDLIKVVMPNPSLTNFTSFSPKLQIFRVRGALDLGKYDYDERFIVTTLAATQRMTGFGDGYSGLRIKLRDSSLAPHASSEIGRELGYPYWTRDWQQLNQNLLEAIRIEKPTIFFVILIMVVAACFNISSTLFVTVLRRYSDIAILRTMGASRRFIMWLFSAQGLLIGIVGALLGLMLGLILCWGFAYLQHQYQLLPGEIYKVDQFSFDLRWPDLISILLMSFVICFLSTLAPARRGAHLDPVEGLRYE